MTIRNRWDILRQALRRSAPRDTARIESERENILTEKSGFFVREAYKTLRTNVTFALADEEACKVLIVTSAMQSEGKSITAINLAISYAEMNHRVLLIDCDLRRPKLARLLDMQAPVGLSNLLMRPELRKEAVRPSGVDNLQVILEGDVPPNPSELLGSARMRKLMESLRGDYDVIILDTSPVNMVTDACVLVPESSGVLFVVRSGASERGAVVHAVEQLENSKAKILGFVLNGVQMEKGYYGYRKRRYGQYRRYGYGYGYGYGYQQREPYCQEMPESGEAVGAGGRGAP